MRTAMDWLCFWLRIIPYGSIAVRFWTTPNSCNPQCELRSQKRFEFFSSFKVYERPRSCLIPSRLITSEVLSLRIGAANNTVQQRFQYILQVTDVHRGYAAFVLRTTSFFFSLFFLYLYSMCHLRRHIVSSQNRSRRWGVFRLVSPRFSRIAEKQGGREGREIKTPPSKKGLFRLFTLFSVADG
jgi:hypothetical protein